MHGNSASQKVGDMREYVVTIAATDFEDGVDMIDLTGIEAATAVSLTFIGTNVAFTGTAGDLRAVWSGSNSTVVQGDTNGDKKADFAIEIFDNLHTTVITGADFVI